MRLWGQCCKSGPLRQDSVPPHALACPRYTQENDEDIACTLAVSLVGRDLLPKEGACRELAAAQTSIRRLVECGVETKVKSVQFDAYNVCAARHQESFRQTKPNIGRFASRFVKAGFFFRV